MVVTDFMVLVFQHYYCESMAYRRHLDPSQRLFILSRPCACAQVPLCGAQASAQARQETELVLDGDLAAARSQESSSSWRQRQQQLTRKETTKREIDGETGFCVTRVGGRSVTAT